MMAGASAATGRLRVGLVQLTSDREPAVNIAAVERMAREARAQGAELIATPEITDMLEPKRALQLAKAQPESEHQALAAFRALARDTGAWLLIGSLVVKRTATDGLTAEGSGAPFANRSFLVGPDGGIVARYDKIHMFDVQVGDGQRYRESEAFHPGNKAVLAPTPWGKLGMTVCYDLRFPYLYRALAQAGARLISIPAAFTRLTGEAHWHVLQRARAIETGCFVIAPAQTGTHAEGRQTFGHSLVVAPWGEVLADGGMEPCVVMADLDLARVDEARAKIPALEHDRALSVERVPVPAALAAE